MKTDLGKWKLPESICANSVKPAIRALNHLRRPFRLELAMAFQSSERRYSSVSE